MAETLDSSDWFNIKKRSTFPPIEFWVGREIEVFEIVELYNENIFGKHKVRTSAI
jgi:hypothetical protein